MLATHWMPQIEGLEGTAGSHRVNDKRLGWARLGGGHLVCTTTLGPFLAPHGSPSGGNHSCEAPESALGLSNTNKRSGWMTGHCLQLVLRNR